MASPRVRAESSHSNLGAMEVHSIEAANAVSSWSSRTSARESRSQHVRPTVCSHNRKHIAVSARKPRAAASPSVSSRRSTRRRAAMLRALRPSIPTLPTPVTDSSQ
eukprot:scaffold237152_cov30-Tisochrysis_lutea.AAC.6